MKKTKALEYRIILSTPYDCYCYTFEFTLLEIVYLP